MKKYITFALMVLVAGCSFFNRPSLEELLKDPHYQAYLDKQDELERRYLAEEITYYEYLEKKQELEHQYDWEVKERNKKLAGPE